MDLHQFVGILRARWRFIALALLSGALLTGFLIMSTPATYASSATLFVSTPSTGLVDPYSASAATQQRAKTYAQLGTDPEVLNAAARRLNAGMTGSQLGALVTTGVVEETLLLEVNARASSPELAQQIATVVSDEIIRTIKKLETPSDESIPAAIIARVAAKATLNPVKVAPNIPLSLTTGLALSLLAGIAGAVVRDVLDATVKTNEEVQTITGAAPMVTLPFDAAVRDHPLSTDDAAGSLSEGFRVLRTNLQFANLDTGRQTIVVTSSIPDEGKTFVATNLAISMAKAGRSVLLLDADMRNPNVSGLLGLDNGVGFVTVLLGRASIEGAIQPHVSGVSFMGTGPQPPNPAEVLDTKAMRDLLANLRNMFDVVVVDAPPLLPVADAAILLTEVDGALLLVRYGDTHREQLRQAVARVKAVHGKLLGTVMNRAPERSLGQYGYGYGYGYGSTLQESESGRAASKGRRRARR